VVVADAHLILVECCDLPQNQMILGQAREASSSCAERIRIVHSCCGTTCSSTVLVFGIGRGSILLGRAAGIYTRLIAARVRLEGRAEDDSVEEVLRYAILFVEEAVDESDHLLFDQGELAVILEGLD